MTNSTIKTWRERIGAGPDFPLHAPTDVERAMEAEIAELREQTKERATLMTERQAEDWAWKQVECDCKLSECSIGERGNYYGFFLQGWRYRAQYERQRPARACATSIRGGTTS